MWQLNSEFNIYVLFCNVHCCSWHFILVLNVVFVRNYFPFLLWGIKIQKLSQECTHIFNSSVIWNEQNTWASHRKWQRFSQTTFSSLKNQIKSKTWFDQTWSNQKPLTVSSLGVKCDITELGGTERLSSSPIPYLKFHKIDYYSSSYR